MERRIQLAEEMSSSKRDLEADELRRELEEARMAERMAKIQLEETRSPLTPPPLLPSTASPDTGVTVRLACWYCCACTLAGTSPLSMPRQQQLQTLQQHILHRLS